ncbi:MAG: L-2-hydroxyglutarate oxidase, partial [Actinobacteria bacterium]
MGTQVDVAVVGGGILGLSTAYRLLERRPGLRLTILEKEPELGAHQTSHNSGVLHSGLYYRPGSLKARLCIDGKAALERFAEEQGVPFRRCGKVVVAVEADELPRLARLKEYGTANGIPGLEEIGPERLREIEPNVVGIRALHLPQTGVIDFRAVATCLAGEIRSRGAEVRSAHQVTALTERNGSWLVHTSSGEVEASFVVSCAGLHADRVGQMTGRDRLDRTVPFRGDYYTLVQPSAGLVNALVYPVPNPAFPFLGVHFTRYIDGHVTAGPNAVLALAREGYRRRDVNARDVADVLGFRGFRRLARRHWRMGLSEVWRDVSRGAFLRECRRYIPGLRRGDMRFGPSGVRAQLVGPDGALADDFSLRRDRGILHVL